MHAAMPQDSYRATPYSPFLNSQYYYLSYTAIYAGLAEDGVCCEIYVLEKFTL